MGGLGSGGRWHFGTKNTTDYFYRLDVRKLQREGHLTFGRAFTWQWSYSGRAAASIRIRVEAGYVTLSYYHGSGASRVEMNYPVKLEWTPCQYGGHRVWFRCPARGCGRRVAVLYGGQVFACRHCYQLAYPSQNESVSNRATRRAEKIRARLGWEPGTLDGEGEKPKGMHWRTYWSLLQMHDDLVDRSMLMFVSLLKKMERHKKR